MDMRVSDVAFALVLVYVIELPIFFLAAVCTVSVGLCIR